VIDQFLNGEGALKVRVGFIPVGASRGPELDQGEILRFLTEMIWFPSAFALPYLEWKENSSDVVEVTIPFGDQKAKATFHFGADGDLHKITARRYQEVNGDFQLADWDIGGFSYHAFEGIRIPYQADVRWMEEDGPQSYYQFSITDLKYNPQVQ
jgi:hypothetical protein